MNADGIASKKNSKWTATTIRAILANEKYTGDVIFQKTYTDENFNRHINYGEVDQYMAPDHHEAIISHEDLTLPMHWSHKELLRKVSKKAMVNTSNATHSQEKSFAENVATPSSAGFILVLPINM